MLSIPEGSYALWPHFRLELPLPITISPEKNYYLEGNNGSGKSSFIKKILLPRLKSTPHIYSLYWEQQIQLQGYAIRAHAAFNHHQQRLNTDYDCLIYLLNNLKQAMLQEQRPAFFIADECLLFNELLSYITDHQLKICLIFTHHHGFRNPDDLSVIRFTAASNTLGIARENSN